MDNLFAVNALEKVVTSPAQSGQIEQAFELAQIIEEHLSQTVAPVNIVFYLPQYLYPQAV